MHRKQKYSARAFYLTLLIITAIAIFSFLANLGENLAGPRQHGLLRRTGHDEMRGDDLECRFVHKAHDKCAFVKANCPDEEAGLVSYLTFYYCRLPNAQPIAFVIIVLWLALLFSTIGIAASDFFCVNLSTIANILGMSESMAGVTFLAFGNGSPDVFSTFAAMNTHSGSLAVGELIGAAGFITAVVAGSMALVRPFKVARKSFVRDVGFFIVAVSFSMVFLADGSLHLWECAVMVAFYVFYVLVVVVWHWWLSRSRRRREKDAAARGHYIIPGNEELEVLEEYHEDEEVTPGKPNMSRVVSAEDFRLLEQSDFPDQGDVDEEVEEEARGRWLGELSSNMRLSRPSPGERRTTGLQIRPSLVGALEFRAVLSSLHSSRNIQTLPMNVRRYSDGPNTLLVEQQTNYLDGPDGEEQSVHEISVRSSSRSVAGERPSLELVRTASGNRIRAVSFNGAARARFDTSPSPSKAVPTLGSSGMIPPQGQNDLLPVPSTNVASPLDGGLTGSPALQTPVFSVSPPPPKGSSQPPMLAQAIAGKATTDLLAPPDNADLSTHRTHSPASGHSSFTTTTPSQPPRNKPREHPELTIPNGEGVRESGQSSPFPSYTDYPFSATITSDPSSAMLPPNAFAESYFDRAYGVHESKPLRWWPYKLLPPPGLLYSTLFPTLYGWREKNLWGRILGVVSAPSVFLLTITLPVVDSEEDAVSEEPTRAPREDSILTYEPEAPSAQTPNMRAHGNQGLGPPQSATGGDSTPTVVVGIEDPESSHPQKSQQTLGPPHGANELPTQTASSPPSSAKGWNRWLVIVQCFTAPFFVVLIVWANTADDTENGRGLIRPTLYSLLGSLLVLAFILVTTTPSRPPPWRVLLCFVGFAVSIAWISTIASEVVGVLKTLGVVLDISDAILGLTIFAVGNSLGDLVADITVAKLGYPVMALSACFGGPMLNILLGIGLSGLYMTISGAEHKHHRHPDQPMRYKPYQIEVSSTLLISAVSLLVTLVGLLLLVPLNGWRMDRRIGWALIALWSFSTVGNLVAEALGWGGDITWT